MENKRERKNIIKSWFLNDIFSQVNNYKRKGKLISEMREEIPVILCQQILQFRINGQISYKT